MNAHINHDLPAAMVSTCTALATAPDTAPHPADYQKVDQLWAVRDNPVARGLFLDTLATATALASQMLLVAV